MKVVYNKPELIEFGNLNQITRAADASMPIGV